MNAFFFVLSAALLLVSANAMKLDLNRATEGDLKNIHFSSGGYDYAFYNGLSLTFGEAVEHCEAAGGNLASINSQTENNLIDGKVGSSRAWIGYFRDEAVIGRWNWIDGSGGYTNWDALQPNDHPLSEENCVQFYGSNGKWHDYGCDVRVAPLCKRFTPVTW